MLRMGHERGLLSTPGATKAMPSPNKKQRPRTVVLGWLKSGRNDRHSGLKFSQAAFKTHPFQILETGYTGPINEATPSVLLGPDAGITHLKYFSGKPDNPDTREA